MNVRYHMRLGYKQNAAIRLKQLPVLSFIQLGADQKLHHAHTHSVTKGRGRPLRMSRMPFIPKFDDTYHIRILFFQKYTPILMYSIFTYYVNKNRIRKLKAIIC